MEPERAVHLQSTNFHATSVQPYIALPTQEEDAPTQTRWLHTGTIGRYEVCHDMLMILGVEGLAGLPPFVCTPIYGTTPLPRRSTWPQTANIDT